MPRSRQADPQVDRGALIDLRRVGGVLRRRWMVLCAAMAAAIVIAAAAYIAAEPRYLATAQVALERTAERVINVDSVVPTSDPDSAAVDTEVQALRSPELIGRVVDRLRLARDPAFNNAAGEGQPTAQPDLIGRQRAIGTLLGGLTVKRDGLSYAISVSYEGSTPVQAAQIANALVDDYVSGQVGSKTDATQRASKFLEQRLEELRTQLLRAEREVADYRAAHNLFAVSEASTITQQELSGLSTQLAQAKAENAAAQARLSAARAQLAGGRNGEELGDSLDSPVVSQLRAQRAEAGREVAALEKRYGPRHPALMQAQNQLRTADAAIAAEVQRIVANVSIQASIANQRAGSLAGSVAQSQGKLASDNEASVRLGELERNAESSRTLYQAFLDRYRQTVAQAGLEQSDSYIVSRARVPGAPSSPNMLIYAAMAIVGGLGIGVLLVVLLQLLERGIETSDAIEDMLGLSTLASIPDANTLPGYRKLGPPAPPAELLLKRPQSTYAEAFRTLRTSIQFAEAASPIRVVAITSAVPGEGKTTTAMGLARAVAAAGGKVLLIDADARRRASSRQFTDGVTLGLDEVLAGQATLDQAIVKDSLSGAFLLPQRIDSKGVGLTESPRLAELIEQVRERYDLVILDTPPVLPVDEARVIASMADGVVLLVRWRKTPSKAVSVALRRLYDVHAEMLGAVLTLVDVREQERAGYEDGGTFMKAYRSYYAD
ncbi:MULTISPECIES: polysaccharide biosynthesis tyrosine autokinase [unclassified Sphingopyxis]|jgi:capsular exopolysaccharide synthesis family protein|uniref:GumC family protein n=1 Tax=unclassified Sphingopyxis TaxID=2614943 RepID=UPI0006C55ABB|nr:MULTISPECIES: polysaccharide biosynthesis tyrosine autokinase [unclassified Sphingopyxis]USI75873.1 polysaccharide biosynthesis tyrosine autokinase [Sphingopyxis sp. USTB-05]GAO77588.1 succinoglycan biosynthesis transport protein [Sphingopyxis sp. C-1]